MKRKIILSSMVAAVLTFGIITIPAAAEKLSLNEAVRKAYEKNPQLQALREKIGGKEASLGLSKSQRSPRFSLSGMYSRTDNPVYGFMSILNQERFSPADMAAINNPGEVENFNTKFSLQIPVYSGRALESGIMMAGLDRRAAELEFERKKQEIRLGVVQAYLDVLMAREGLKVAGNAYTTAEAHVKMARSHFEAGTVVKSDLLSAEVRLAQVDEMRLGARNRVELAKANLMYSMGEIQGGDVELEENPLVYTAFENNLEKLIGDAMARRAEMKQFDSFVEMSRRAADAAAAGRRPSLNVMAEYNMDNEDIFDGQGESWLAGVMIAYNIFDGGRTKYQVEQARRREMETGRNAEALRQGIELQVRQAFLELQTAGDRIKVTEKAATQAEEALRIVQNRYDNGLTTIVEVLKSETELTEARLRHVAALHDYALGLEKLHFAAGTN